VAAFLVLFVTMFARFYSYWEEDPPRIVLHYSAAFVLLLLLPLKIAIPRFYSGLRKHLFPIGFSLLLFAFIISSSALTHYLVRVTQLEPYISHSRVTTTPNLELGKQLFIEKCRTCHLLDKILQPRSPEAWEKVVDSMAELAWPRIRPDEAGQILNYLSTSRVPQKPSDGTGYPLLDKHCLSCHTQKEIFEKPRTRHEWDKIVLEMTKNDPALVPADRHDQLVDALVDAQAKAAGKDAKE
jgi:hypothetical protein